MKSIKSIERDGRRYVDIKDLCLLARLAIEDFKIKKPADAQNYPDYVNGMEVLVKWLDQWIEAPVMASDKEVNEAVNGIKSWLT